MHIPIRTVRQYIYDGKLRCYRFSTSSQLLVKSDDVLKLLHVVQPDESGCVTMGWRALKPSEVKENRLRENQQPVMAIAKRAVLPESETVVQQSFRALSKRSGLSGKSTKLPPLSIRVGI
jgi:hypothetical protein